MSLTTESAERQAFLEERKTGIGGSDIASVLGLSPWKTPLELWEEKTGRKTEPEPESDSMYWGRTLENVVAQEFEKRMNKKVKSAPMSYRDEWRIANIDRLVGDDELLECKTANAFAEHNWGESQEEEIKTGTVVTEHTIPIYYETQVQWYLHLTGFKRAYLAVLIGGNDYRIYQIDRDDELIDMLETKAKSFWENFVLKNTPPPPINEEDVKHLYARDTGEFIEADNDTATTIGEMMTIKAEIDHLKEKYDAMKKDIVLKIEDKCGFNINGHRVCTYKSSKRKTFRTDDFKADYPDLYDKYIAELQVRTFKLY